MLKTNRRSLMKSMAVAAAGLSLGSTTRAMANENAAIDDLLKQATNAGHVPGVAAAVTNSQETIFSAAHGTRSAGGGEPVAIDTEFFVASMTKPITSVAALQLVEQGKIDVDEPLGPHVPELAELQVLEGYNADGTPQLRPATTPVTLRQLLTHTSGYVYDIWNSDMVRYYEAAKLPALGTAPRAAFATPLAFDPGTAWEYGIGIDWAGLVVEAVSGMRLGQYLQQNVTGPIGMNDTGFNLSLDMRSRLTSMHARGEDGGLAVIPFETNQYPEVESGGAGLYSTVPDYLKFMRMILNKGVADGNAILKPETVTELLGKNAMGDLRVTGLTAAIPFLSKDAEFFPGLEKTWSLGFMINEAEAPTGRSKGSMAWAGLANTYFWIDPVKDIAGVAMMQLFPFVDDHALALFTDFEKSVYSELASV